uniref:Uncharacterized protein n=1 Tax=Arundo donax TaxID=35708 RepID=A0A0A9F830_ARUDO
MRPILNPLDS